MALTERKKSGDEEREKERQREREEVKGAGRSGEMFFSLWS